MANDEILTDDYVAGLLAKDAKESSIKYSALGLEAFGRSKYGTLNYCLQFTNASRPPASKPKPNTRFLRNIIKDTDNHNAALLAKEAAESRARLQSLASNEHREEKASRGGGGDIRRRQLGDIAAILGGRPSKRRKTEGSGTQDRGGRRVNTSSEDEEPEKDTMDGKRKKLKSRREDEEGERSYRKHHRSHNSISDDRENYEAGRRRRRISISDDRGKNEDGCRRRNRSRSPREHQTTDSRHRHRSPRRKQSRSPRPERGKEKSHRSHRHRRSSSADSKGSKKESARPVMVKESKPNYDSDPLDEIIGPRPPPVPEIRSRGRGTVSHASGIDSRFSAAYDPTVDVQLDMDEENDWDQALEALRDRQKWKQQGADRLRAAGFTEDEISKWEKGGEKREDDVKWAKKGEGREWDRGKVVDDDGIVMIEPQYGRLKDT
jgi:hypothetical protein